VVEIGQTQRTKTPDNPPHRQTQRTNTSFYQTILPTYITDHPAIA